MKRHWRQVVIQMTFWLTAEIVLNGCSLDTIADYSEFLLFEQRKVIAQSFTSFS